MILKPDTLPQVISVPVLVFWFILVVIAASIYWSRRETKRSSEKFLAMLMSLDPEKREQVIRRLSPKAQAKVRDQMIARGLI